MKCPRFVVPLVACAVLVGAPADRPCLAQATGPTIVALFPAGAQRGTTVEATVIGEGILGATEVYVSGEGVKATVGGEETVTPAPRRRPRRGETAEENPKPWTNAQVATNLVRLSVEIAHDAARGPRDLRLITPGGLTQRWRFFVDELPEVVVAQTNGSPDAAVPLESMPTVVNGQVYSGWVGTIATQGTPDRAFFRFPAKAGQTLVCHVQARKLIPFIDQAVPGFFDACLTLRDASGRRLDYCDDFRFSPDPVLIHKVGKDAEYLLELRDIIYRSNHDFIYRMRIGTLPYLTHVFPLGGRRNTEVELELCGVNLPADRLKIKLPAQGPMHQVTVSANGLVSNALPLVLDDLPELMEEESKEAAADAQPVSVPAVINGRIEKPGDADCFALEAEAGQTLVLEVQARRLGSPLDSVLTLYDPAGEEVARYDDPAPQAVPNALGTGVENDGGASVHPREALMTHRADARIVHTLDSAGKYVVRIADVTEKGGPEYAYRLRIAPAEKDFTLRIKTDAASVGKGDHALIALDALRKDGFDGPIRVEVEGLPPGFVATPTVIPAGGTDALMTITAPDSAPAGLHRPKFVGKAEIGGKPLARNGVPVETVGQAFYIKHLVPTAEFLLHVGDKAFYTLSTDVPAGKEVELKPGATVKLNVKAERLDGAKGPISVEAVSLPEGVRTRPAQIGPGKDQVEIALTASSRLPASESQLVFTGTMNVGKQPVVRVTPAIPLKIPGEEKGKP